MNQGKARFPLIAANIAAVLLLVIGVAALIVYTGAYNVAADAPHTRPLYWLLNLARDRSIAVHAADITVPTDLWEPNRILTGAGLYNEMCSGCHLGPGLQRTEISRGLYPRAPEFAKGVDISPAEAFWVIKHGIKMTGMAAWGPTHNDALIWDMVAFLRKLPQLTPAQYQAAVKNAPQDHDEIMHDTQNDQASSADHQPQ